MIDNVQQVEIMTMIMINLMGIMILIIGENRDNFYDYYVFGWLSYCSWS